MFEFVVLSVIVLVALVLFVSGWLAVDVVGLLVLASLTISGIITPDEALAGFSSSAVVTVWGMFILSAGLTHTGVAYSLGRPLQLFARGGETVLVIAIMVASSLLSALINTTTVAAILLPAVMELARRSNRSPSRLLMPMALGCLLGGPFTGISTTPNILVTDAMRTAGLVPFGLFDFTPITGVIVIAGITFMVLGGMRLLPRRTAQGTGQAPLQTYYQLNTHVFSSHIGVGSPLAGRTLIESRLGSALHMTVVALRRKGRMILSPRQSEVLQEGDDLLVHGVTEHAAFHGSQHLRVEADGAAIADVSRHLEVGSIRLGAGAFLIGRTLGDSGLRREHHTHLLSLKTPEGTCLGVVDDHVFAEGDQLVLQGEPEAMRRLAGLPGMEGYAVVAPSLGSDPECGARCFITVRVPAASVLVGRNLVESRLGSAFGLTVVGILRAEGIIVMPQPAETICADDVLVLHGMEGDLDVFEGLQALEVSECTPQLVAELESQKVGVAELLLSPRTTLAGKTLTDLLFREHYGLSVLAIWRRQQALRTDLSTLPLQFGDALLVYGPRKSLEAVARDSDFLVLDEAAAQAPRLSKAPLAAGIMFAVIASAILGLVPIAIAALTGAAIMVVTRCLSMEEAYRAIEWKVVFLVASMLPLGVAIQKTGAAQMGAEAVVAMVGDMGPRWVVAALFAITVLGTQIIPTAALVVLMTPVALSAAASLDISPHLLMMTVAIAASASFASPLSHPAHLLVMGPGGYRFTDYVKVGVPLTLVTMLVAVWLLPLLWPA